MVQSNFPLIQMKVQEFSLDDIYNLVERNLNLDPEDYEWQSPTSAFANIPITVIAE